MTSLGGVKVGGDHPVTSFGAIATVTSLEDVTFREICLNSLYTCIYRCEHIYGERGQLVASPCYVTIRTTFWPCSRVLHYPPLVYHRLPDLHRIRGCIHIFNNCIKEATLVTFYWIEFVHWSFISCETSITAIAFNNSDNFIVWLTISGSALEVRWHIYPFLRKFKSILSTKI